MSTDHALVLAIRDLLSGREWSPETLEEIAEVLRQAGYTIEEPTA